MGWGVLSFSKALLSEIHVSLKFSSIFYSRATEFSTPYFVAIYYHYTYLYVSKQRNKREISIVMLANAHNNSYRYTSVPITVIVCISPSKREGSIFRLTVSSSTRLITIRKFCSKVQLAGAAVLHMWVYTVELAETPCLLYKWKVRVKLDIILMS